MKKLSLTEKFERLETQKEGLNNRKGIKLPVVILADTSGSMNDVNTNGKTRIDSLNEGIEVYFQQMLEDSDVQDHIDIAIISFGINDAELVVDFAHIKEQRVPVFKAAGGSPMCDAIYLALEIIETQLGVYQDSGIPFHPPHLIMMTDGIPTLTGKWDENGVAIELKQSDEEYIETHKHFQRFMNQHALVSITVGIGERVYNPYFLEKFASTPSNVLKLDDHNIVEFFKLLSRSTSILSRSVPTADLSMDFDKVDSKGIVKVFNS